MGLSVMWFRKDLRLDDNTALNLALAELTNNDELLCMFQLNPDQFKVGTMNHDYFFTALQKFANCSKDKGFPIHFIFGEPLESFRSLKRKYPSWSKVYFNRDERGKGFKRDQIMMEYFHSENIEINSTLDAHLHGAFEIKKKDGSSYKMFTPYYKQWCKLQKNVYSKLKVENFKDRVIVNPTDFLAGSEYFEKLLLNSQHDFSDKVGSKQAELYLNDFILKKMNDYDENRDIPSLSGTSKLSSYLRSGEISIRKVWHTAWNMEDSAGKESFLKELCWRDFYNMISAENPHQHNTELKEKYKNFPWNQGCLEFEAWKKGQTGYPIIDAAMRQLNQTGWMHNRLRMLVASFLTKDLLIDWRLGEEYFSKQLIDYDSASNVGGWQWAASTGTDAVPYFRIFNPTTQGKKFDEKGSFIRAYLPELKNVPDNYIHEPQKMTLSDQYKYKCVIGSDYPEPIVNHKVARAQAIELFKEWS